MLNVTGLNRFYYLRDFTDMRCKHSRVLSIIREQLHGEPDVGNVFIVMSRNRRIVRLFIYIFAFLKDGSLPIGNNLAVRAIPPLTTLRNAMLHFGSDEGVEMAATYHSIISTVKMQGRSAWEYLGKFFTKIFNGCRDFFSMRPDRIFVQMSAEPNLFELC